MFGPVFIAAVAAAGVGIWVYRYFAKRATGAQLSKTITPALITAALAFIVILSILVTSF